MTIKTASKPVTEPAIPADEAFGNVIMAKRDSAVVDEQALQSQRAARQGQFERDTARLRAEWEVDMASLDEQIDRQARIIVASDAALESLKGKANVVDLKRAAE